MDNKIKEILNLAQESTSNHVKYSIILKKECEKNMDQFVPEMIKYITIIFNSNFKEKNVYAERLIDFLSMFCTSMKPQILSNEEVEEHPVFCQIFEFVLKCSTLNYDTFRYWSCKLISKVFENLEEISGKLYDDIKEHMLDRLQDPISTIRFQAITALHRLQDPNDKSDPIIKQFIQILERDSNAKVRRLCLEKVAVTRNVLPVVLTRIRDVDENVRITAFKKVSTRAPYITVSQRRYVVKCGFFDESNKVNTFVTTELIPKWLDSYSNDYLKLIKSLRLDATEEDIKETVILVEFVLNALFQSGTLKTVMRCVEINENKCLNYENLNWDSVLYYRFLINFLRQSEEFEEILNSILPELSRFCKYIKGFCDYQKQVLMDTSEFQFILKQLFSICEGFDVSDTASRQDLTSLVTFTLDTVNLQLNVAEVVVRNLEKTITDVRERSMYICEIISNIAYQENGLEGSGEVTRIDTHQSVLKKQEEKQELYKKSDVSTILKYLTVAGAFLLSPKITELLPALYTLNNEIIKPVLMHEDDRIKTEAFRCYAVCCIIDESNARYGMQLFTIPIFGYNSGQNCNTELLKVCISAVVDLLLLHGPNLIAAREDAITESESNEEQEEKVFTGGISLSELIRELSKLLEDEDLQIQEITVRGICKLLLNNRIHSASLISLLIIKWANPATDPNKIKQFIGLTLKDLPTLPDYTDYFEDALLTTIRTFVYAPKDSPLNDVKIENICKLVLALCETGAEGKQMYTNLAFKLCHRMLAKPRAKINQTYAKVLTMLKLSLSKETNDDLLVVCDELRDKVSDQIALRNVTKFIAALNARTSAEE